MSSKDDCQDNAVIESFCDPLKQERVHWRHYQTRNYLISIVRGPLLGIVLTLEESSVVITDRHNKLLVDSLIPKFC
jgi:hypothetical protein